MVCCPIEYNNNYTLYDCHNVLAQKKKEEDAKQKSLIGDGRYFVSSNNGKLHTFAARLKITKTHIPGKKNPVIPTKIGCCVDSVK